MDWRQEEYQGKPERCWFATPTPNVRINIEPARGGVEVAIFVHQSLSGQVHKDLKERWFLVADHVFPKPADPKREAEAIYREWLESVGG